MSSYEEPNNPELESFRQQWRAEVQARAARHASSSQRQQHHQHHESHAGPSSTSPAQPIRVTTPRGKPPASAKKTVVKDSEDDYVRSQPFDEPVHAAGAAQGEKGKGAAGTQQEPVTALEHYERAVEKEAAGNLGESLRLYRKAFQMDDQVDQKYRNKHFPKKPAPVSSSTSATGAGFKTTPTSTQKQEPSQPIPLKDLIESFSSLTITPAPPVIEGTPPPPCPIASLPEEILVQILEDVAINDVGDFVRLSLVCKRFAYLVATEDRIWRRICLGSEFGFGGMHYYWQCQITWEPLTEADLIREAEESSNAQDDPNTSGTTTPTTTTSFPAPALTLAARARLHAEEKRAVTLAFYNSPLYSSSWQRMWRLRPRIRFNGVYISTVNYMRPGLGVNQVTWGASPIHIVTYYRYLRFFRDGTVISLLTTAEPGEVVHHLTKEYVAQFAGQNNIPAGANLPGAVMRSALKGRWRMAREGENPGASLSEIEGDVIVETEGVSKYFYRLDLTLATAGKGARNNKLVWKGFYSYNTLTGDWAEFTLKHNKPFFFSRVRSYGVKGA